MSIDEEVLVISTKQFQKLGSFQGFRTSDSKYLSAILDPAQFSFRSRSTVENDPDYKQLIPYAILKWGEQLFQYRRGAAGTEKRLAARRSIGIGGHISRVDAEQGDPYRTGMLRELTEEVQVGCDYRESIVGLINDDRTFVGQVHLGIVHVLELSQPSVVSNEATIAEGSFQSITRLWEERDSFETWSQFALAALLGEPLGTE
jgi:predicted NUDIX family phosphoesterase